MVCIRTEDSMILSEPDDTHLTVFQPDPQLLELIKTLAPGEGLFVWESGDQGQGRSADS